MSDNYIDECIKKGDLGSGVLRTTTAPSLRNNSYVEIVDYAGKKIPGLRIPQGKIAIVHSASGDYSQKSAVHHTESMVMNLGLQAQIMGVEPAGFANVVDSNKGDLDLIESIGSTMEKGARHYGFAILNGENAILGNLINPVYGANVFGTAVSVANEGEFKLGHGKRRGIEYFAFDPKGQFIFMNSDGVGTKTYLYVRNGYLLPALIDSFEMKASDSAKLGAEVKVLWDNVEFNFSPNRRRKQFLSAAKGISNQYGFSYLLNIENVGDRVVRDRDGSFAYNVSGNAVSVISNERLRNPLYFLNLLD